MEVCPVIEDFLYRKDVLDFLQELKTNDRYFDKKLEGIQNPNFYMSQEASLYLFYDALWKFSLIIPDHSYVTEYIEQVEKLYRKLDSFNQIREGIHKLLATTVSKYFKIENVEEKESREKILSHIYEKYIQEGYFIHGFHSHYIDAITKEGFIPEQYENYYDRFQKANSIFAKYNMIHMIPKNFQNKNVYFTDDFFMGCYFSLYAPSFFYQFFVNEDYFGKRIRKDCYLKDNYDYLLQHLKRLMSDSFFSEEDKKFILELVEDEWNLLHKEESKVSLLLVKRKELGTREIPIEDFLQDESDLFEVVDRMLSPKYTNISYGEKIEIEQLEILSFEKYTYQNQKEKVVEEPSIVEDLSNENGSVTILLALGSLLISLGVLLSIFFTIRGL